MTHKLSILLVEDEKNICDFISTSLSAQDYRISTAHTGKEALPIITSQCPDLILLDLGLPDMDGMEIIRQVRTWSSVPIIVLSARTQEQEKVRALDLGADDYLTKPIGTSELLARIRTASGASVSSLFLAGVIPGLMIGLLLMLYAIYHCRRYGEDREKIHAEIHLLHEKGLFRVLRESFFALLSPVIILGCIYSGIASPTEAAVISVF